MAPHNHERVCCAFGHVCVGHWDFNAGRGCAPPHCGRGDCRCAFVWRAPLRSRRPRGSSCARAVAFWVSGCARRCSARQGSRHPSDHQLQRCCHLCAPSVGRKAARVRGPRSPCGGHRRLCNGAGLVRFAGTTRGCALTLAARPAQPWCVSMYSPVGSVLPATCTWSRFVHVFSACHVNWSSGTRVLGVN